MSFLLSRFFRILLISVRGRLLLKRMSLLQIPAAQDDMKNIMDHHLLRQNNIPADHFISIRSSYDLWHLQTQSGVYISFTVWPSTLYCVTFVCCIFNDLIDQFLLVVRPFHLTEKTETAINQHPSTSEADNRESDKGRSPRLAYLELCRSFILYKRPELFFSRSSWPCSRCHFKEHVQYKQ